MNIKDYPLETPRRANISSVRNFYKNSPTLYEGFYTLASRSYSEASFTPVTLVNTDTLSFNILNQGDTLFVMSGDTSEVVFNPATSTVSVTDDNGNLFPFPFSTTGSVLYIEIRFGSVSSELWVNNTFQSSLDSTLLSSLTLAKIGKSVDGNSNNTGALYNITLGSIVSWPLVSYDVEINADDYIGDNDLIFSGTPSPLLKTNLEEVTL